MKKILSGHVFLILILIMKIIVLVSNRLNHCNVMMNSSKELKKVVISNLYH